MRKISFLIILSTLIIGSLKSQNLYPIRYSDWSNPTVYKSSPSPTINGYGSYSDSLSYLFNGKTFYEYNSIYYSIETWADYFYWFTQKYSYKFDKSAEIYEYYYYIKDNYQMAVFVADNFNGNDFPSKIKIKYPGIIKTEKQELQQKNNWVEQQKRRKEIESNQIRNIRNGKVNRKNKTPQQKLSLNGHD